MERYVLTNIFQLRLLYILELFILEYDINISLLFFSTSTCFDLFFRVCLVEKGILISDSEGVWHFQDKGAQNFIRGKKGKYTKENH